MSSPCRVRPHRSSDTLPRMPMFFRLAIALAALAATVSARPAAATEVNVEKWHWNLDNTVRQGTFNTLLLVVSNVSKEPFEGFIGVTRGGGITQEGQLAQPLYLGVGQRQFKVYFDVYVEDGIDEFFVTWATNPRRLSIDPKRRLSIESAPVPRALTGPDDQGSQAIDESELIADQYSGYYDYDPDTELPILPRPVAALDDGATRLPPRSGVPTMPTDWFPPSAVSLPGEGVLLLDHAPRLQPAQETALLDWIRLGGELRIYRRTDAWPDLAGELGRTISPLAESGDGQTLGAGRIVKISKTLAEENAKTLRDLRRPPKPEVAEPTNPSPNTQNYYGHAYTPGSNPAASLYSGLSFLHRPDVNWVFVFTLFGVYIVALVGGGLLVSRRTRSWQKTYLTLLATVALFSFLFWQLGARGHGEQTTISTIAVAEVMGEDRARFHGWSDLFTTEGRTYVLRPGEGRGALRPREQTGFLPGGPEPGLAKYAPSFSSITLEWQAIAEAAPPRLVDVSAAGSKVSFTVVRTEPHRPVPLTSLTQEERKRDGSQTGSYPVWFTFGRYGGAGSASWGDDGLQVTLDLDRAFELKPTAMGLDLTFEYGGVQRYSYESFGTRSELLNAAHSDLLVAAGLGTLRKGTLPQRVDVFLLDPITQPVVPGIGVDDGRNEGRVLWRMPLWIGDSGVTGPTVEAEPLPELDEIFDPV